MRQAAVDAPGHDYPRPRQTGGGCAGCKGAGGCAGCSLCDACRHGPGRRFAWRNGTRRRGPKRRRHRPGRGCRRPDACCDTGRKPR
eukprot:655566-Lingulodinium_polyedra.AAC.1